MSMWIAVVDAIDRLNSALGRFLGWIVLLLVMTELLIVILAGNFQMGSIKLQEFIFYLNSLIFLGAAGYVFVTDSHVRVDIFYRGFDETTKAWINLWGTIVFLIPFLIFLWSVVVPYVATSWLILESSFETSGLPLVFVLKSFLLLFVFTLTLQSLSVVVRSLKLIRGM